jgi:Ca2+/Na+ antiporter
MIIFYFYLIGGTSEQFLTPALSRIANFLKMSENLAGVTLLAFGNGAADVVSSIVASGLADGIYMSASGLIGSCTANSYFLAPLVVILSKKPVILPVGTYSRDMIFLLSVQAILLGYLLFGTIYWFMALLFPIIYVIYVSVCFYVEVRMKRKVAIEERKEREAKGLSCEERNFENDLARTVTEAEANGDEIVRREGESFVRFSSIDIEALLEGHMKRDEEEPVQKVKNIRVEPILANKIRNKLWMNAVSVAVHMYYP